VLLLLCAAVVASCGSPAQEITSDGVTITAPAGAVPPGVELGAAEVEEPPEAVPDELTVVSGIFELTPHGTEFASPVTVEIPFSAADVDDLGSIGVFTFDDLGPLDAGWTAVSGAQLDASGVATFDVDHFSWFLVAEGELGAGDDDDSAGDDDDSAGDDDDDSAGDDDDDVITDDDDDIADDDDSAGDDDDDSAGDDDDSSGDDDDSAASSLWEGDLSISTDEEAAGFCPQYTGITGDVTIQGSDSLTSLSTLACLEDIGGSLQVIGTALSSVGLTGLKTVGGPIVIHDNTSMTTLGLPSLESVGGDIDVQSNGLQLFDLPNLQTLAGGLMLDEEPALTDLQSLGTAVVIGGALDLGNGVGTDLPVLSDIDGLSSLVEVTGGLSVTGAAQLENLAGLGNLETVGGSVLIAGNALLDSLAGLETVETIGLHLSVTDNPVLNDMLMLTNNLSSIGGDVTVTGNSELDADQAAELTAFFQGIAAGVVQVSDNG